MPEKRFVTWAEVENFIDEVAEAYKGQNIKGVYGIPRGGLVLAVMLSHKMRVPLLGAACDNCIICDDICDSGETLLHYYLNSSGDGRPRYHIATMFYKQNKLGVEPEFHKEEKDDAWIVFPWEKED